MKSIRFKLWAGMMALVLVVLLLLWFFQIVFLKSFYTRMRISDIKDQAVSVVQLLDEGKYEDFQEQLDVFAYENNMSIEMIDMTGSIAYLAGSSGMNGQLPMMRNSIRNQVVVKVLNGEEAEATLDHPRMGNKFMLIGLPVNTGGDLSGALLITLPLAPVEDTAFILQKQLVYISIILLAAALCISFLLARSFTRPIIEIKKTAEKMAAGDYYAQLPVRQKDEIGQLAQTVNYLGQQFAKIDQMRKDLIANVSHELRTPLSLIRGYAETLRDVTGNEPDKRERQLGIIIDETERLSRMVDDILHLSRLQSGHFEISQSCFGVNDLVNRVAQRYDLQSQQTRVAIRLDLADDAIVKADEDRVEQVLYNLINNAFNHSAAESTITIRSMDLIDRIRIEVADTGSGIPAKDIAYIWDRYYKAETRAADAVGSGLGLAIVKALLEAHGANFGVESQEDVMTIFWFELLKA
ncbi:MAG: histidine kinase dimerization/phospho-acceptor domain-containing protein [Syntrophomonas sp.]|nr:histidine kinase dimerization/phospho-acceptor domain-containing protein [Syntrophomonas sp.]